MRGILLVIILLAGAAAAQTAADLVLINGKVRTLEKAKPPVEAMAVSGGRITAIGTSDAIRKQIGPATVVLDAKGKLVIPGFNDAHVHFAAIGTQFFHLDLRASPSVEAATVRLSEYTRFLPPGQWLLGSGLTTATAKSLAGPLDKYRTPILLYVDGYRSALVNASALGKAELDGTARIVTESELTRIRAMVPADHSRNIAAILEAASAYVASFGVTSVQDVHSDDLREQLIELERRGKLKTRVYECLGPAGVSKLGSSGASDKGMVRSGCIKTTAPFEEDEFADFSRTVREVIASRGQLMVHAIGGRSNANALDVLGTAAGAAKSRERRFRLEHASGLRAEDLARVNSLGIVLSMQPQLFRWAARDDYQLLEARGVRLAFGSDAPMIEVDPLHGIDAAVNAEKRSMTVESAVRAYTAGSAYAEFQEREKGSLTVGKLADFVILSEDIFTIPKSRISETKVITTVVAGEVVYQRP